jgi:hypothetical protein
VPVLMITYHVAGDGVAEVTSAIEKAFAAVEAQELDEGIENPLPGIQAARDLQATVARWATEPAPVPRPFELVGDYRMLGQEKQ